MLSQGVVDQVQAIIGADSIGVPEQISEHIWSVDVAFRDGPHAVSLTSKLFDFRDGRIHIWGF